LGSLLRWKKRHIAFESLLLTITKIYSRPDEQQCRNIAPPDEVGLIGIAKPNSFGMMQRVR
jgi:hypothetical protein